MPGASKPARHTHLEKPRMLILMCMQHLCKVVSDVILLIIINVFSTFLSIPVKYSLSLIKEFLLK